MDNSEYHTKLAGTTFEGRQEIIANLTGKEPLRARREPDNKHDKRAVAIDANLGEDIWAHIGYIAKDKNKDISEAMDSGNDIKVAMSGPPTGGGDKNYGVNISVKYKKAATKSPECSDSKGALELLRDLIGKGFNVNISKEVQVEKVKYRSPLIGRSIELEVHNGHKSLPGFLSGSKFPEKFYKEFNADDILSGIVEKFYKDASGEEQDRIKNAISSMWELNRDASTGYGTAIHAALECYDKYQSIGDKIKDVKEYKTKPTIVGPNKALSRNPFIKKVVDDFHEKFGGDYIRFNEQFVWILEERLCGAIDRVKVIDPDKKIIRIQDYKTDSNIHDKRYQLTDSVFYRLTQGATPSLGKELLDLHWLQLSFYAYILSYYGYIVEGLDIFWLNPDKLTRGENAWELFSHDVIDIKEGLKENN